MPDLPEADTLESAYRKAYVANRSGKPVLRLVVNAQGRRWQRRFLRVWPDIEGVNGFVLQRLPDEDGVIERLIVQVDPVDILAAYHDETIKRLEGPKRLRPQRKAMVTKR